MSFQARLRAEAEAVHAELDHRLAGLEPAAAPRLLQAMRYAVLGPGKRLRAILCLWTAETAGANRDDTLWRAACSLELLHAYSLVHDDLPAMDDDDLRRGRPSCHRAFDEATAILAGDALQTQAFHLLAGARPHERATALVEELAAAAGVTGMVAGQQLDLDADAPPDDPIRIHRLKTGALLGACIGMGLICAGRSPADVARGRKAGIEVGVAFQIVDDVLDATATAEALGKSPGKDAAQDKRTAVAAWGVEGARAQARLRLDAALVELRGLGLGTPVLTELLQRLVERQR